VKQSDIPKDQRRENDEMWKAWKTKERVFHPSHNSWKSLQDFRILTAPTTTMDILIENKNDNALRATKGVAVQPQFWPQTQKNVNDVSGPKCKPCLSSFTQASALRLCSPLLRFVLSTSLQRWAIPLGLTLATPDLAGRAGVAGHNPKFHLRKEKLL
jgi:hypothetical protein